MAALGVELRAWSRGAFDLGDVTAPKVIAAKLRRQPLAAGPQMVE
jgi:hypothetical protein